MQKSKPYFINQIEVCDIIIGTDCDIKRGTWKRLKCTQQSDREVSDPVAFSCLE